MTAEKKLWVVWRHGCNCEYAIALVQASTREEASEVFWNRGREELGEETFHEDVGDWAPALGPEPVSFEEVQNKPFHWIGFNG